MIDGGDLALVACLRRHPFKQNYAEIAGHRIAGFMDDDGAGMIQPRNARLRQVEELFAALKKRRR